MKSWELKGQSCGTSGQACEMQTSARSVRGLALEPSGCSCALISLADWKSWVDSCFTYTCREGRT